MKSRTWILQGEGAWDPRALPLGPTHPGTAPLLARHRTGWTALLEIPPLGRVALKIYFYPRLETLRGAFRNTFLAPSRPAREARTLLWLRRRGLGAVEPLAFGEERFLGWLKKAWILTRYVEAPDLEDLFRQSGGIPTEAARALGSWMGKAHALGLEDRNPHLRNFLFLEGEAEVLKLDSPKARIGPAPAPPRARRRDLAVLEEEARRLGLDRPARRTFLEAYREAWETTSKRKVTGPSFTR